MRRTTLWILVAAALAVLAALLLAPPAHGASFLDRVYGTPLAGTSARSRAMGGAGTAFANGAYSLIDNPAALALERTSSFELNGTLMRASENRFVPLYDTFDSYVDQTAIAVNGHSYASLHGGFVIDRPEVEGLVLGAGVFERYDPRYDYFDERRTTATTDEVVSERFISTEGMIRSATLGGAIPLPHGLSVGAAMNGYFGTITDRDALVPRAANTTGPVTSLERELFGLSLTLGALARIGERVTTGLAVETPTKLTADYTRTENDVVTSPADASVDLRLPARVQGGVTYRPRNDFRTVCAMDVVWMPWSRTDDPLNPDAQYQDTWDVRLGLEHLYYNALPGRIGFRYSNSYAAREVNRAAFTFGLGYRFARVQLDLAGEIGKQSSRQEPIWPRADQPAAVGAGKDRVDDTLLGIQVGSRIDF